MERRTFIRVISGGFLAAPLAVEAQQTAKVWRVGFLGGGARTPDGGPPLALRQALQELGYVERQNVIYLGRWAEARRDRLPTLAADRVGLNVDASVTFCTPSSEPSRHEPSGLRSVLLD